VGEALRTGPPTTAGGTVPHTGLAEAGRTVTLGTYWSSRSAAVTPKPFGGTELT